MVSAVSISSNLGEAERRSAIDWNSVRHNPESRNFSGSRFFPWDINTSGRSPGFTKTRTFLMDLSIIVSAGRSTSISIGSRDVFSK